MGRTIDLKNRCVHHSRDHASDQGLLDNCPTADQRVSVKRCERKESQSQANRRDAKPRDDNEAKHPMADEMDISLIGD